MDAVAWALLVGWIGSVVFGLIALAAIKLDCWHEKERKRLATPLPTTDPQPSPSAGICGLTSESEISTRANGGLVVRKKVRVG